MKNFITLTISLLLLLPITNFAQIDNSDKKISVQGFLKDGNGRAVEDGPQAITFGIYDAETGGAHLWESIENVTVFGGVYSVQLGVGKNPANMTDIPIADLNWDKPYYLQVTIQGTPLTPRTAFTYSPYSIAVEKSARVSTVECSGAVGDIKYSILNPTEFAKVNGDCWVLMDGTASVWETTLGGYLQNMPNYTYNSQSKVPDVSGAFIRAHDVTAENRDPDRDASSQIAEFQEAALWDHSHWFSATTSTNGDHSHTHYGFNNVENGTGDQAQSRDRIGSDPGDYSGDSAGAHNHTVQGWTALANEHQTEVPTSSESRPRNFNFYAYIRIN